MPKPLAQGYVAVNGAHGSNLCHGCHCHDFGPDHSDDPSPLGMAYFRLMAGALGISLHLFRAILVVVIPIMALIIVLISVIVSIVVT